MGAAWGRDVKIWVAMSSTCKRMHSRDGTGFMAYAGDCMGV